MPLFYLCFTFVLPLRFLFVIKKRDVLVFLHKIELFCIIVKYYYSLLPLQVFINVLLKMSQAHGDFCKEDRSEDQRQFLETIKCLVLKGGKFLNEALALARAMLETLEPETHKMSARQATMHLQETVLYQEAQSSKSLDAAFDVACKLSKLQLESRQLDAQITESVIFYSTISDELVRLQQFARSQRASITITSAPALASASARVSASVSARAAPVPAPSSATIDGLRGKVEALLQQMTEFWISYDDAREVKRESTETRTIVRRILHLRISDVRGDGACGWRAFITGVIRILCGKQLSYDPARMIEFIHEVKVLLVELVHILVKNPANKDFITDLMTVPENGRRQNLATYTAMVLAPDYQATNFELRLLCVLFGLVNPQLSQVNIIQNTPSLLEIYQSMSGSGRIEPVSNQQINILHVPGHYKSIIHLTEGILPCIISPDGAIIIN